MRSHVIAIALTATRLLFATETHATTILDPTGDAVAVFGIPGSLIDISSATVTLGGADIMVSVEFSTAILPASQFAANSLGGGMDFDFGRNPLTGDAPFQNHFAPFTPPEFGSDISVDFFRTSSIRTSWRFSITRLARSLD